MKILNLKDKKELLERLEKQYGITSLPGDILKFGEDKYKLFSGKISSDKLLILDKELRIENAGLYFAKNEPDGIRLTLDGLQILKDQITKNILDLNDNDAKEWLKGNEIYIKAEKGFKVLKNNSELIGCGKATGEKIANFMPKERRVK
jgi:NOL1/NOP2/fmu family ribosome biogenesis protein